MYQETVLTKQQRDIALNTHSLDCPECGGPMTFLVGTGFVNYIQSSAANGTPKIRPEMYCHKCHKSVALFKYRA